MCGALVLLAASLVLPRCGGRYASQTQWSYTSYYRLESAGVRKRDRERPGRRRRALRTAGDEGSGALCLAEGVVLRWRDIAV